jgi:hypothetical protein
MVSPSFSTTTVSMMVSGSGAAQETSNTLKITSKLNKKILCFIFFS